MEVRDLGTLPYREAWERQLEVHQEVLNGADDTLLLVQHPAVLTLGASFQAAHLRLPTNAYNDLGIDLVKTDRGGDVTYHGPGQLVIYPIFDLKPHGQDLHRWIRDLEGTILDVLDRLGIEGRRFPPHTGVWVGDRKVAAIGIKVRRWVSLHGIALNCDLDLAPFESIVPCGIEGYGVTSVSELLGERFGVEEAKPLVIEVFRARFTRSATHS